MLRITLLSCLAAGTLATFRLPGSCPPVTAVKDFDALKIAGKWYEAERYFAIFELGAKCVTLEYLPNNNGTITIIVNGTGPLFDNVTPIAGLATFKGDMDEAEFTLTIPSLPIFAGVPYSIIGTDYVNWALAWSCTSGLVTGSRYIWLLTREQNPSRETMEAAYAALKRNRLNRRRFVKTNQRNC